MAEELPGQNLRRDIFMFLGFIVVCLTGVAIVAIANGASWTEKQWAAIAASGSIAQALGVFIALAYAHRQTKCSS